MSTKSRKCMGREPNTKFQLCSSWPCIPRFQRLSSSERSIGCLFLTCLDCPTPPSSKSVIWSRLLTAIAWPRKRCMNKRSFLLTLWTSDRGSPLATGSAYA